MANDAWSVHIREDRHENMRAVVKDKINKKHLIIQNSFKTHSECITKKDKKKSSAKENSSGPRDQAHWIQLNPILAHFGPNLKGLEAF